MVKDTSRRNKSIGTALLAVLVLALAGFGGFFFWKYTETKNELSNVQAELTAATDQIQIFRTDPAAAGQAEVTRIVEEVSALYALPENEEPSVATVRDKELLKDQPFFEKAENDDVTLIYTNAKLALLYRPSTKQIVNVSTVAIDTEAPAEDASLAPQE